MTQSFVGLRFVPDGDGTGRLSIHAQKGGFSGSCSAWVSEDELAEFGKKLMDSFPLRGDQKIELVGIGHLAQSTEAVKSIELRVYPISVTGAIGVRVSLTTSAYEHERDESQRHVSLEIITRYGPLRDFGEAVCSLTKGALHARLDEYEP